MVDLSQQLSSILDLVFYDFNTTGNFIAMSNSNLNSSLLAFNIDVFPLGEVLTIRYVARIDPNREGNITADIIVNYVTIQQDGIGEQVSL